MRSEQRHSISARLLIFAGMGLQLMAALSLWRVDPLLEYAISAPEVREIPALVEDRDAVETHLGEGLEALSMGGLRSGTEITFGDQAAVATLQAVDLCWLETCPRQLFDGRWMDAEEVRRGARVAVLDEDLTFTLFGSESALGREIDIEGEKYAVIGTLRHRRNPGEADAYAAYIPLMAATDQGVQMDVIIMRALCAASSGAEQSFVDAMRDAWGAGELHNLSKERLGALLQTRIAIFALGAALLLRLIHVFKLQLRRWWAEISEMRARWYARRWLPPVVLRALTAALESLLMILAAYGLLAFGTVPAYSFTEWIPESLVSLSALRAVFWNRAMAAARLIVLRTPESTRIAFWGGVDRIAVLMFWMGLALNCKKNKKTEKRGNQTGGVEV